MMVQVPQIALLCYEIAEQLAGVVEGHLLPLVIKTLTDIEESVRKTAQTAFIMLMEQNLVTREAIEDQVCPVVLMLADMGTLPDYHSNAVVLMSKIAPLVGREKAMELFLDHFVALCSDPALFVRTVCAANIGDFCTLMGTEVTEHVLLPCFVQLCKDSIWGVRKECANVFLSVSCVVTLDTRKKVLAPIFVDFLIDQSRWVKVAAFHSLGPFIWTYAPDTIRRRGPHSPAIDPETPRSTHQQNKNLRLSEKTLGSSNESNTHRVTKGSEESSKVEAVEPENDYNTFLFWRLPLPEVGPDASIDLSPRSEKLSSSIVTSATVATSVPSGSQDDPPPSIEDPSTVDQEKMDVSWCSSSQKFSSTTNETEGQKLHESTLENKDGSYGEKPPVPLQTDKNLQNEVNFPEDNMTIDVEPKQRCRTDEWGQARKIQEVEQTTVVQDIVPQALIDHYISMSTPLQFIEEDPELAFHCAFNFPAVALTLGRENWTLLSGAYEVLAVDVQWKVRRTLASSLHELAVILGEELATRYLVPVFSGFVKDLDEVRIGVVKHLADFLRLIGPDGRNECLSCLSNFLMTDNQFNWRFRNELIKQLMQVTNLFSPEDVSEFLTQMGMSLLLSKVAIVRRNAVHLVAEYIRYLSGDKELLESLLKELAEDLAESGYWIRRQSYVFLCEQLLVPRLQRGARANRDGDDEYDEDDDDEEEGGEDEEEGEDEKEEEGKEEEEEKDSAGRGQSANATPDESISKRQEDISWRRRIASSLGQFVYPFLLDLSCDKVPNVRLAVARVLGSFKVTPAEERYLHSFLNESNGVDNVYGKGVPILDMALANLQEDKDPDVRYFALQNKRFFSGQKAKQSADGADVVNGLISPL